MLQISGGQVSDLKRQEKEKNECHVFGLWGDFSIHCNLESLDDIQCDRSLFEKSRQIVECTKIKMLLQMGLGPNMLEWTTKKKEAAKP